MFSIFLVFGTYIAAKVLLVGSPIYGGLSALMPEFWWQRTVGMSGVLALLVAVVTFALRREGLTWAAAGLGPWDPRRELPWACVCAGAVLFVQETMLNPVSNDSAVQAWGTVTQSGGGRWLALLSTGFLGGSMEEILYRGALFALLRRRWGNARGARIGFIVVSAAVFAGFHGLSSPGDYAVYSVIGAIFASVLSVSGSLRSVIFAHVAVNCVLVMGWGWYLHLPSLR